MEDKAREAELQRATLKPGSQIVISEGGTYITGNAPSQYLPSSETAYVIKLNDEGRQYVTNNKDFSKWVSDFFPDMALL